MRYWKRRLLDTSDARVFLELDQLYKKLGMSTEDRIAFYEKYADTFVKRDDVFIEYITMKNLWVSMKKHMNCLWEENSIRGKAEKGKATTQYTTALVGMAKKSPCREKITRKQKSFWKSPCLSGESGRRKA